MTQLFRRRTNSEWFTNLSDTVRARDLELRALADGGAVNDRPPIFEDASNVAKRSLVRLVCSRCSGYVGSVDRWYDGSAQALVVHYQRPDDAGDDPASVTTHAALLRPRMTPPPITWCRVHRDLVIPTDRAVNMAGKSLRAATVDEDFSPRRLRVSPAA